MKEVGLANRKADTQLEREACFVPRCTAKIIQSHSQQRNRELAAIAESGHVIAMNRDNVAAIGDPDGFKWLTKVGIARATTFPGFCRLHDERLFRDLDTSDLTQPTLTLAAQLALRAFAYEYRSKQRALTVHRALATRLSLLNEVGLAEAFRKRIRGLELFMRAEGSRNVNATLRMVQQQDATGLHCQWHRFGRNVGASVTCIIDPRFVEYTSELDFLPALTFHLIPEADCTHAVFCWLHEDDHWCRAFLEDDQVWLSRPLVNRLAFAESQDTTLRPSIWESASEAQREKAVAAIREDAGRSRIPTSAIPRIINTNGERPAVLLRA